MWPYWLLFFIPAYLSISRLQPISSTTLARRRTHSSFEWQVMYVFLVLMIGLRHETGGDWVQYSQLLDSYAEPDADAKFLFQDPAFVLLYVLGARSGLGLYLVNFLSAIIFSWGLLVFCRSQPRPWLALVVAVPYLITVVAIGYTRQGAAIGIAMVAMVALSQGSTRRFMFWIAIAALFHKSAILLVPMAVVAGTERRLITAFWVVVGGLTLFVLLLQEAASFLVAGYIDAGYQSSGASIRITMNVVPAVIFLLFRKRFDLSRESHSFWTWMSWGALLFVGLLLVSPSSTAVDRVALYWIPLQVFVFSRVPSALGVREGKNALLVYAVVVYCAAVHFVWLTYAETAFAWLPYQFYPWVWLWR